MAASAFSDPLWFWARIRFENVDLLDLEMDGFPQVAKQVSADGQHLPLISIGDELFCSGVRIDGPGSRRRVEEMLST